MIDELVQEFIVKPLVPLVSSFYLRLISAKKPLHIAERNGTAVISTPEIKAFVCVISGFLTSTFLVGPFALQGILKCLD